MYFGCKYLLEASAVPFCFTNWFLTASPLQSRTPSQRQLWTRIFFSSKCSTGKHNHLRSKQRDLGGEPCRFGIVGCGLWLRVRVAAISRRSQALEYAQILASNFQLIQLCANHFQPHYQWHSTPATFLWPFPYSVETPIGYNSEPEQIGGHSDEKAGGCHLFHYAVDGPESRGHRNESKTLKTKAGPLV